MFCTEPPSVVEHGEDDPPARAGAGAWSGTNLNTERREDDTSSILTTAAGVYSKSSRQSSSPFVIKPPTRERLHPLFCSLPRTSRSLISSKFKEIHQKKPYSVFKSRSLRDVEKDAFSSSWCVNSVTSSFAKSADTRCFCNIFSYSTVLASHTFLWNKSVWQNVMI